MKENLFRLGTAIFVMAGTLIACSPEPKQEQTEEQTTEAPQKTQYIAERELEYADYAEDVNAGKIPTDTLKTSARREATGSIGGADIKINYGSPGVRNRIIWNGLVAYDQVWVTGAHTSTRIDFSKDFTVGETTIPAGSYGFFTIPSANEWTLILNRNYDQHLVDQYNESEDVVRIKVKPEEHPMTQRLTYAVETTSDKSGAIVVQWEKVKVSMPFTVK